MAEDGPIPAAAASGGGAAESNKSLQLKDLASSSKKDLASSSSPPPTPNYDTLDRDALLQLLAERDEKIASHERTRSKHDETTALLRSELGAVQIKHKEECYWLRLEVDNLRKDKEAVEDRMAELYRDMREIDNMNEELDEMNNAAGAPVCVDSGYVLHLQSQLSKSMQTMGVLDNQIGMVKRSCDEVVRSLKEEIADVMDDKCRIEMELLNQLAVLDNEKKNLEDECEERLRSERSKMKCREEHVAKLKEEVRELKRKCSTLQAEAASATSGGSQQQQANTETGEDPREREERIKSSVGAAMASASAFAASDLPTARPSAADADGGGDGQPSKREADLLRQVDELHDEIDALEDELAAQRQAGRGGGGDGGAEEDDPRIVDLEDTIVDQEDQIERLVAELDGLRRSSADDAEAILMAVQRDRDEALSTLDRIAEYWEKADESIQILEDVMEELRPTTDDELGDNEQREKDKYRTLSTLETATLVHSQIKVSLLLVELKCRNQLTTLRNDVRLSTAAGVADAMGGGASKGASGAAAAAAIEESVEEISDKIDEVQAETMNALQQVELNMTGLIQSLEGGTEFEAEAEELRAELGERIDRMIALQDKFGRLEAEHDALKRTNEELSKGGSADGGGAAAAAAAAAEAEQLRRDLERVEQQCEDLVHDKEGLERTRKDLEKTNHELELEREEMMGSVNRYKKDAKEARAAMKDMAKKAASSEKAAAATSSSSGGGGGGDGNGMDPAAQQQMFEMLQKEIFAVVGKIKDKNEEIGKLQSAAEEHKVREAALKKELKRIMKRVRAIEEGDRLHGSVQK